MAHGRDAHRFRWLTPAVAGTARLIAAGALAYVYVVVLMTASAQSMVSIQLEKSITSKEKLDYSSSYAQLNHANVAGDKFMGADAAAREAEYATAIAQLRQNQAGGRFSEFAVPLSTLATRLNEQQYCDISDVREKGFEVRPENTASILSQMRQCLKTNKVIPSSVASSIEAMLASDRKIADLGGRLQLAWEKKESSDFEAGRKRAEATDLRALRDHANDIRKAFSPITLIKDRLMLGGDTLVQFPPPMMQVVMAFFSGTFGALLVTLVLVVYPSAKLTLTTPGGNYGERVLLGGLIAVCVYIVLSGGSAVLGSANAFSDGSANYQAFSAIGVLAGMFSDRVAQWLSTRADTLYGSEARNGPDIKTLDLAKSASRTGAE